MSMDLEKRLHIVEDDPGVADSLSEYFRASGFDVMTYDDGRSFMDGASLDQNDTVIIDLALPDMSGSSLYEWIKTNHQTVFPIIVTGQSRHKIIEMTGDIGVEVGPVFRKPLNIDQLLDTIEQGMRPDQSGPQLRAV